MPFLHIGTLTGRVDYVKLSSSFSNIKSKAGGALEIITFSNMRKLKSKGYLKLVTSYNFSLLGLL